tara:strand:- start:5263 stop:6258 length:996 start_codon:yes stop_codon:yes gene_type:complete
MKKLDESTKYGVDPYTRNFGAGNIVKALGNKYGQRYFQYRKNWDKAGQNWIPDYPLNLVFDLVDQCNLACPQCLRARDLIKDYDGYIGTSKYLDKKTIFKILDESKKYNLPSINIGGSGECTLHPDFIEICERIMKIDPCELRIISNGIRLKDDIAKAMIDLGVHMISVSIDGFSPETFAASRGKAHRYNDVVENTINFAKLKKKMKAKWPLLRVSFVEQESNKHEREDFVKFWSKYADMIDVQIYHDFRKKDNFIDFECFEPFKRLTIWAYGGAGPCCGFPGIKYNVGNFANRSIFDIWHGKEIKRIRKMMITKDYELPCLQCQGSRTVL